MYIIHVNHDSVIKQRLFDQRNRCQKAPICQVLRFYPPPPPAFKTKQNKTKQQQQQKRIEADLKQVGLFKIRERKVILSRSVNHSSLS